MAQNWNSHLIDEKVEECTFVAMKRVSSVPLRRSGILRLSTWLILAGSTMSLTSCDSSQRKAREAQAQYEAESKKLIEELDSQRQQLLSGEVPNNFHIPGVGYYHAASRDFYPHSYNMEKDGKWFVNNEWVNQSGPATVAASRPTPEALRRIDEILAKQEQSLDAAAAQVAQHQAQASSGPGLGSALMMYWLLSGNRGAYGASPGLSRFGQRAPLWESKFRQQRDIQARTTANARTGFAGTPRPVRAEARSSSAPSARGGFGSNGRSSSS